MTAPAQRRIAIGSHIQISVDNVSLPVGTVAGRAADVANVRNHLTKVNHTMWRKESGQRHNFRNLYDPRVVVSLPGETTAGAGESVAAEIEEMKQRIRTVIDDCIRRHGDAHAQARDGAWMRLGLMDLPRPDSTIPGRSAFGLPVGSIVTQGGVPYSITEADRRPQQIQLPGYDTRGFHLQSDAQIVLTTPQQEVIFYSADDLLNKVWQEYWPLKELHGWCSFVEGCMREAGLNNPGPQPQEYRAVEVEVETVQVADDFVPQIGDEYRAEPLSPEIDEMLTVLRRLSVGSTVRGLNTRRTYLRTDQVVSGWVRSDTLAAAMTRDVLLAVEVTHVAGQQ